MRPEVRRDLGGVGAELDIERIAERVRGIRAHDQGAVTGGGAADSGGGGDRGLAYTALTGEQNDPHVESLRAVRFLLRRSLHDAPGRVIRGHVLRDLLLQVSEDLERQLGVLLGQVGVLQDRF